MKWLALFLIGLSTSIASSQEFICGYHPPEGLGDGAVGARQHHDLAFFRNGGNRTIQPVVLFGKFANRTADDPSLTTLADRDGVRDQRADRLLTRTHIGSLAHFMDEMSYGTLTLAPPPGGINTTWFESDQEEVSNYVGDPCSGWSAGVRDFVEEVIGNADDEIDFSHDALDKNDNDMVDMVIAVVPAAFGSECGPNGTVFYDLNNVTEDGVGIETVITTDWRRSMPFISAVLAHEYGHIMGLPELFDRDDPIDANGNKTIEDSERTRQSAGIGNWGVMGGASGWPQDAPLDMTSSGPNPYSVWSRAHVRWVTPRVLDSDEADIRISDINTSSTGAYKIPIPGSDQEYFLVENRQNTHRTRTATTPGSYYDGLAPTRGLAIWHIDEGVTSFNAVSNEKHKRVDLESADGLFSDKGYDPRSSHAPQTPDTELGGDNLDFSTGNDDYDGRYNGNRGDEYDLWDGSSNRSAFTPHTNPSSDGHEPPANRHGRRKDNQNAFTGVYIENISTVTGQAGVMEFDVRFAPLAPNSLDAAIGEGRVELTWEAPDNNHATIASYNWTFANSAFLLKFEMCDNSLLCPPY